MKKIIHMRFVSGMYPWFFSPSKNDVTYRQVKVVHLFMQCSDFNWFRTHRLKVNAAWKFQCMCALLLYCVDDFFPPPVESACYWIKNKQGNGIIVNIPSLYENHFSFFFECTIKRKFSCRNHSAVKSSQSQNTPMLLSVLLQRGRKRNFW